MFRNILILTFVICCRAVSLAACDQKSIATIEVNDFEYYPHVISLSTGQDISDDTSQTDDYQGYFYRVVIARSEIYKSIIIEKISYGTEGFNMKFQSVREINIDDFSDRFGYTINLIVQFEFLSWISPTSFACRIHGDLFLVSDIDKPDIMMMKID